ncbi:MAG: purine-binding chemotaxis protein CheW [Tissierellia bacterium]|jgi:purine-binding chemotaxis protein CheW|nr:purine-binding chemotaxis protein CheW [Tissierellia bacterium]
MQVIVFTLGESRYAISTDKVEEITKNIQSTEVPNSPDWVEGIINLRGNVVTLLNLSKLLQQDCTMCYNNIIILKDDDEKVGLLIGNVDQVMDLEDSEIQKITDEEKTEFSGIIHMDDTIVNMIDIEILLSKNEGLI